MNKNIFLALLISFFSFNAFANPIISDNNKHSNCESLALKMAQLLFTAEEGADAMKVSESDFYTTEQISEYVFKYNISIEYTDIAEFVYSVTISEPVVNN